MPLASEKSRGTYFLSAMMIALSFLAMIVPLAMYHVAQIAAASGLRRALVVLLGVAAALSLLGSFSGQQLLLFSGLSALAWFPAFAVSLQGRIKGGTKPLLLSLVMMLIVPGLTLAAILGPAPVSDFEAFLREGLQGMIDAARLAGAPQAIQNAEQMDQALKELQGTSEFLTLRTLFENKWDVRLLWLVFGSGSPWLFGILVMALGNLVLLDLAFEQIEKLRAVTHYILAFPVRFTEPVTATAKAMQESFQASMAERFSVRSVRRLEDGLGNPGETRPEGSSASPLRFIIRPVKDAGSLVFMGYRFQFADRDVQPGAENGGPQTSAEVGAQPLPSWRLRELRMPLPVALSSIALLLGTGYTQTTIGEFGRILAAVPGSEALGAAELGSSLPLPLLALVAAVSFAGCTLLAVEGILVALSRVTPIVLLLLLLFVVFAGTVVAANPLLVIAVLGAVGLLDHLYDFRKLRPNTEKPG